MTYPASYPNTAGRASPPAERTSRAALRRARSRRALGWGAAFAVTGVLVLSWAWPNREAKNLTNLPAPERAALHQRTLSNLETVCGAPRMASTDYCREEAELLLKLPECDEACRALARKHLTQPAR